ncbi:MAG: efflux RND transporter periplasmic adaptor subunit [Verrucomicrobia bacterium]|nr:efflux RND transporter periplasmic adaptor subunit [Verrucomicrobiota bacterium]
MSETLTTPVAPGSQPTPKKKNRKAIIFYLIAAGVLFVGLAAFGIYTRNQWTTEVQARNNDAARVLVEVVHPQPSSGVVHLQLPGEAMAFTDSPIVAQTSGYLKEWYFDIGSRVKKGDVLAEIETPEVDQQLAQAQAQLKVAQAASDLAEVTYRRDEALFKNKVIAAQDFDTAADNFAGARSTVIADQAAVGRLQALEAFKIVRAPFDGIVTARNTDVGDYVAAGSETALFRMAATSVLRVYVTVPQAFSSLVKAGEQAELTVNEFPGQTFPAHVVSTAGAINPNSKRLLTELEAANPTGAPLPGAYVQTTLDIPIDGRGVLVPTISLLFEGTQPAVAVIGQDGRVEIHKINIVRDLGTRLQVSDGLSPSDQLIVNPPPGLTTGTQVTVVKSSQLVETQ